MNYYLDNKFTTCPEMTVNVLINSYFQYLHKALVVNPNLRIGISFPDYNFDSLTLGSRLRLHGLERELQLILDQDWLKKLQDYILISEVRVVPEKHKYCSVRRMQVKSNVDRLRRRLILRHKLTEDEAKARIPDSVEKKIHLPFISMKSLSTGQNFRLFINQTIEDIPIFNCDFNSYGLSKTSMLPFF